MADSAACFVIHWIGIYLADSVIQLSNNRALAPVVQRVDSNIYQINH